MILAALVGDTVGSVYEWENVKREDFPLFTEDSCFTDDSVMTIAVADALLAATERCRPLSDALVDSMRQYGRRYPDAGYGGRFRSWLRKPKRPNPYNSWGNGSAMRVSPVGWMCQTLEAAELLAAETAKVTHNHPEGIRGAQAVAACIVLVRHGASNDEVRDYMRSHFGYAMDFTLEEIRPAYTFDVSCQGSVPQAIQASLEADGLEDTVRKAISIGGDSDTIAAIAASIAQGRYGVPEDIELAVRNRLTQDLLKTNDRFCAAFGVGDASTDAQQ